jgi:hypothetical protein
VQYFFINFHLLELVDYLIMATKFTNISWHGIKYSSLGIKNVCRMSTQVKNLILVDHNNTNGISTVTLNSPPVNSLNFEVLTAFSNVLSELEEKKPKGVILTSVSFNNAKSKKILQFFILH